MLRVKTKQEIIDTLGKKWYEENFGNKAYLEGRLLPEKYKTASDLPLGFEYWFEDDESVDDHLWYISSDMVTEVFFTDVFVKSTKDFKTHYGVDKFWKKNGWNPEGRMNYFTGRYVGKNNSNAYTSSFANNNYYHIAGKGCATTWSICDNNTKTGLGSIPSTPVSPVPHLDKIEYKSTSAANPWRFKTESEFTKDFGSDWRTKLSKGWNDDMNKHLGQCVLSAVKSYDGEEEFYGAWSYHKEMLTLKDSAHFYSGGLTSDPDLSTVPAGLSTEDVKELIDMALAPLKVDLEDAARDVSDLKCKVELIDEMQDGEESRLNSAIEDISSVKADTEEAYGMADEARDLSSDNASKIDSLESTISGVEDTAELAKDRADEAMEDVQSLEEKVDSVASDVAENSYAVIELKSKVEASSFSVFS